jgi:CelD/BcsL family acetyltransferase involved in cellulose biosynthesis
MGTGNRSLLSVEILPDAARQALIADEWDAAIPPAFTQTLSQSAWYFAWKAAFTPKRSVVITARESGRLVGLMALSELRTDARGLYFSQITNFTGGDYQVPVVAEGAGNAVLSALLDAAIQHFGKRRVYWWANLPADESCAIFLGEYLRSRGIRFTEEFRVAPRLAIRGRSFAEVEKEWAPNHRTDVRRQKKRLSTRGELTLWEPENQDSARELLEEFFLVHDEKWLSQGQPGKFQEMQQRKHFIEIVEKLFGRGLHFSVLRCGKVNVSFGFGFLSDGWIQWYRPTYRPEYQNFSPGKVHIALLVDRVCESGWKGIDFLQGEESYKLQWANESVRTVDYFASYSGWSPGYFWFTQGKPYLKNKAGPFYMRTKARLQSAARSLLQKKM